MAKKRGKPIKIKQSQATPQGSLQAPAICNGLHPTLFLNNLYKSLEVVFYLC